MTHANVLKLKRLREIDGKVSSTFPLSRYKGGGIKIYKKIWDMVHDSHRRWVWIKRRRFVGHKVWLISLEASQSQECALYKNLVEHKDDDLLLPGSQKVIRKRIKAGKSALYHRKIDEALNCFAYIEWARGQDQENKQV